MTTRNARIESTWLGPEDHGIPSCGIVLDYGDGGHQGFGGYDLRRWGYEFIAGILVAAGTDRWERLVGRHVRVEADDSSVSAIGHITKEAWFRPSDSDAINS